jgi:hypothetical protein
MTKRKNLAKDQPNMIGLYLAIGIGSLVAIPIALLPFFY